MRDDASRPAAVADRPRSLPDRVLGAVGGALIVLGLVYLGLALAGGGDADAAPVEQVPPLVLLEPAPGDTLHGALALVFTAPESLQPHPTGWGIEGLHLHAGIDGREFMPSTADVQRLGGGRYRWVLGPLEPGTRSIRLFWSDHQHQPIAEGGTPPVPVVAVPDR